MAWHRGHITAAVAVVSFTLVVIVFVGAQPCAARSDPPPGTLLWEDDFDGSVINASRWNVLEQVHRGGVYTADNAFVKDGYLTLRSQPFETPIVVGGETYWVSSGAVNTSALQEQQFGKWVVRAKLPRVGFTPGWTGHNSMWLFNDWRQEIDVFEQTAHANGSAVSTISGNVHTWQCAPNATSGAGCTNTCNGDACGAGGHHSQEGNWSAAFHDYGIEWRAGAITWTVDGQVTSRLANETTIGQYDRPLFLALTACVMDRVPPQAGDQFPQLYYIDSVKVFS